MVTGENKVNRFGSRYIYYRCCRKRRTYRYCSAPAVEEHDVEREILSAIENLTLPPGVADVVMDELQKLRSEVDSARAAAVSNVEAQLRKSEEMLRNLRHLAAEGRISAEELDEDRRELTAEQIRLRAELERADPVEGFLEPLRSAIPFAVQAKKRFEEGDDEKKREICQTIFSDLTTQQKTLLIKAKFPFRVCADLAKIPDMCTARTEVRTLVERLLSELRP